MANVTYKLEVTMIISEEFEQSDEFKEFKNHIQSGEFQREMEEDRGQGKNKMRCQKCKATILKIK